MHNAEIYEMQPCVSSYIRILSPMRAHSIERSSRTRTARRRNVDAQARRRARVQVNKHTQTHRRTGMQAGGRTRTRVRTDEQASKPADAQARRHMGRLAGMQARAHTSTVRAQHGAVQPNRHTSADRIEHTCDAVGAMNTCTPGPAPDPARADPSQKPRHCQIHWNGPGKRCTVATLTRLVRVPGRPMLETQKRLAR